MQFMNSPANRIILSALAILAVVVTTALGSPLEPAYRDATQPVEIRIADLLGRMTLEEKVGQLNMPCGWVGTLGKNIPAKTATALKLTSGNQLSGLGPIGGFFTLPNWTLQEGPRQQAEFLNRLQKIAREQTRLGIPLLQTEEGTHGLMCAGGTIFPEGPALGSTWNMDLLGRVYAATAKEARAIGVHQSFTLVIEPIRDPRLGRNEEAYSEDPYLCSHIAGVIVRSMQDADLTRPDKVVAGLCHFPGQSQAISGFERGAMEVSERQLREVFLPPWETGVHRSGALGGMATYPAIDGIPTHASSRLLTGLLRDEYGFDGLVMSEGGGIGTLVYEGVAASQKEAGILALNAGVDVSITYESGYMLDLIAAVREGRIAEQLVDRAVRRILKQKFRLGLFENPFVDVERAVATVHQADHQALALQAAREGIVLLKNEKNLLPLSKQLRSIAVIGPNADAPRHQLGEYISEVVTQPIVTVLQGIKQMVPADTRVTYVKGCNIEGAELDQIAEAKAAAAKADVAIVVIGENHRGGLDKGGTDGEGRDSATLELTGLQEELVKAVQSAGKPTVVVLINGRPLATRWIARHVPALVEAWIPGEKGGQAVAEVLFGDVNPSGKLSVTVPRHAGQLPVYYNMKKSKRHWLDTARERAYVDLEATPLFPFGFGLSYTRFAYQNLQFARTEISPTEGIALSFQVKNTGDRRGQEVVQLYLEDVVSSVATPVKELRGFAKLDLAPGETKTCTFKLTPDDLALFDANLKRVVEPGQFNVMIGASSEDIRLKGKFHVK